MRRRIWTAGMSREPRRSLCSIHICQQGQAISTDEFSHDLTLLLALWKASLFNAMAIAVKPLRVTMGQKPVSSDDGQTVECKAHRLPNAQESIDGSHFGQHMCRVGSLALSLFEPAMLFEHRQHGIQQHLFRSSLNQALAKVRQNSKVKARIGQF